MKTFRWALIALAVSSLCAAFAPAGRAQTAHRSIEASRFPRNTVFYFLWRGAPAPEVRQANSLYALWDDPDFAPARNALLDSFMSDSRKSGDPKTQLKREEISEFTTLLENPMAFGFVMDPEAKNKSVTTKVPNASGSAAPKTESAHKWNGFFLIYDRTGEEALLAKAILRFRTAEKFPPKISPMTIAGVPATKVEHKNDTEYWIESGKYVITSGEVSVAQQLLTRFNSGSPSQASLLSADQTAELEKIVGRTMPGAPPMSLGGVPAFKEANPVLGKGVFEFFVNLSDAIKLAGDNPGPQGIRPSMVLDSMKMSAVHSISGEVLLDGAKTRFEGGILGETSAGSIFDIWDAGQAKPASIAYIAPTTVSYHETQLNLPALYALAVRVITPFLPKGQVEPSNMMEAAAQLKFGMSITEALNSFTGEFGSLTSNASFEPGQSTYFIGVRNRDSALKLLRRAFLDNISGDVDEGGVTYITLDMNKPAAAAQSTNSGPKFYLAVTKDIILVSAHRESFKAPLAQSASAASPAQLAPFFSSHNAGHATINGLNFADLQKFDWTSLRNLPNHNKATGTSVLLSLAPDKTEQKEKSWVDEIDPKVFTRHLHLGLGYSWKDANGLHFDGWID